MPGRHGYATPSGSWVQGGTSPLLAILNVPSRSGNTPSEYKATQEINFVDEFQSEEGDEFEAFITADDGSGGSSSGSGDITGGYRFGYNGKENDNDVKGIGGSQQDYGLRIYDPRVGKFLSVDPLRDSYPWNSSYAFSEGDPINYIDLDGAQTPTATAQSTRPATVPRINLTIDQNLLNGRSGGAISAPRGQLFNGSINSGLFAPQTRYLTHAEINALIPPNCGASINPDGESMTVTGPNSSWQVSLMKTERPVTEFERKLARMQLDHLKQITASSQRISTNPSDLSNEELQESLDRISKGNGTQQDFLYWREIQIRLGNGNLPLQKQSGSISEIIPREKVSFIQGHGDKAKKIEVDLPEGYRLTKLISHGQAVYTNGKNWITPDQDGHKPGSVWKMFDSEKNVGSTEKSKRVGTFDKDLKKIGD